MAKSILLDCAESGPTTVTVPTTAMMPDNAKSMMASREQKEANRGRRSGVGTPAPRIRATSP